MNETHKQNKKANRERRLKKKSERALLKNKKVEKEESKTGFFNN